MATHRSHELQAAHASWPGRSNHRRRCQTTVRRRVQVSIACLWVWWDFLAKFRRLFCRFDARVSSFKVAENGFYNRAKRSGIVKETWTVVKNRCGIRIVKGSKPDGRSADPENNDLPRKRTICASKILRFSSRVASVCAKQTIRTGNRTTADHSCFCIRFVPLYNEINFTFAFIVQETLAKSPAHALYLDDRNFGLP